MSNYDPNYAAAQRGVRTDRVAVDVDQGLRAHMLRVYNYMALGVAGTSLVTLFLMNNPALLQTLVGGPMIWVWFIAILGMGFLAPRLIFSQNAFLAHLCFWAYAKQERQTFRFKMKDTSRNEEGFATTVSKVNDWEEICRDVSEFADLGINVQQMDNVNLGFEAPLGSAEVWIADFEFR